MPPTAPPPVPLLPAPTHASPAKPTMAERVDAEIDANPLGHQWVVHSTVSVDYKTAKHAAFRNSFRGEAGLRIDALEVVCHVCRRPFDDVADSVHVCEDLNHSDCPKSGLVICSGQVDNTHLIGGDQREREKRIRYEPTGVIVRHLIDRRGMAGYSVFDGR